MAPIYESDLVEDERSARTQKYTDEEWRTFELWEDLERRRKRRRALWIAATVFCFCLLSAIPVWIEHAPKWSSLAMARELSLKLHSIKQRAATDLRAYELTFVDTVNRQFEIRKKKTCSDHESETVEKNSIAAESDLSFLTNQEGMRLGIPGVTVTFCYDPVTGYVQGSSLLAFAIIPVKDLTEGRVDRVSTVFIKGDSAEISFH